VKILGITGGIATGKSTVAGIFRAQDVPVFDADAEVHQLMSQSGAAVEDIARLFPETVRNGAIQRKTLGAIVFADNAKLKQLEAILHPRVRAAELQFLDEARTHGAPLVVLEIPLLFETDAHTLCDAVLVTHCAEDVQKERIMARAGMTEDKMQRILDRQIDPALKIKRADYLIDTGRPMAQIESDVNAMIDTLCT